jgi:hypothetical protein
MSRHDCIAWFDAERGQRAFAGDPMPRLDGGERETRPPSRWGKPAFSTRTLVW